MSIMFIIENNRQWRVVRIKPDGTHAFYNVCDTKLDAQRNADAFQRKYGDRWIAAHLSFTDEMDFDASDFPA